MLCVSSVGIVRLFNFSLSNGCGVVSHCGFNLLFLTSYELEDLFVYLINIHMSPLVNCLFRLLSILKNPLICLIIESYELFTYARDKPFVGYMFANISP